MDRYASYLYHGHCLDDCLARQGYRLYDYDLSDGSKLSRPDVFGPNDIHHDDSCRLQIRLSNQVGGAYARFEHNFAYNSDCRTHFMDRLLDHSGCPLLCALLRC